MCPPCLQSILSTLVDVWPNRSRIGRAYDRVSVQRDKIGAGGGLAQSFPRSQRDQASACRPVVSVIILLLRFTHTIIKAFIYSTPCSLLLEPGAEKTRSVNEVAGCMLWSRPVEIDMFGYPPYYSAFQTLVPWAKYMSFRDLLQVVGGIANLRLRGELVEGQGRTYDPGKSYPPMTFMYWMHVCQSMIICQSWHFLTAFSIIEGQSTRVPRVLAHKSSPSSVAGNISSITDELEVSD